MKCSNHEQIVSLAAGELSLMQSLSLKWHCARCASCRAELAQTRNLWQELHNLAAEPVATSLDQRVQNSLPRSTSQSKLASRTTGQPVMAQPKLPAFALCVTMFLLLAGVMWHPDLKIPSRRTEPKTITFHGDDMKPKTSQQKWLVTPLAWLLATGGITMAIAQPDPHNGGKAANPIAVPNLAPPSKAQIKKMQQHTLQQVLNQAGFKDKALHAAVLQHVDEQEQARETVREVTADLINALKDRKTTDTGIRTRLDTYRKVIAEEKERREKAIATLDEKISFSKNTRLKALLTMLSIVGNEWSHTGDLMDGIVAATPWQPITVQADDRDLGPIRLGDQKAMHEQEQRMNRRLLIDILTRSGYTDKNLHSTIIAFETVQEEAREPLRKIGGDLLKALSNTGVPQATDEQLTTLLADYKKVVDKEQERRKNAVTDLRQELDLDTMPRLEALLTVYGLIGNEWSYVGDIIASMGSLRLMTPLQKVTPTANGNGDVMHFERSIFPGVRIGELADPENQDIPVGGPINGETPDVVPVR